MPPSSSGPSTAQQKGILHPPAAFLSLPVLLTLQLHPGRPGVTANQQKPEQGSLALSLPPTPAGGQPGVLTRPEHKGGSSGKPGDRAHSSPGCCQAWKEIETQRLRSMLKATSYALTADASRVYWPGMVKSIRKGNTIGPPKGQAPGSGFSCIKM